jgi:hypothetical protein
MDLDRFWSSASAEDLAHPQPVRELLLALKNDDALTYDLLFYSAFAQKILGVMKREGSEAEGFARMQQSFSEAVQRVRDIVAASQPLGFHRSSVYTEMTQTGMQMLLALVADLAIVKEWAVRNTDSGIRER